MANKSRICSPLLFFQMYRKRLESNGLCLASTVVLRVRGATAALPTTLCDHGTNGADVLPQVGMPARFVNDNFGDACRRTAAPPVAKDDVVAINSACARAGAG